MVAPRARILDLTRLLSRIGSGPPTGVDRVELAYLDRFLNDTVPVFGLARAGRGFYLLDRPGMERLRLALHAAAPPAKRGRGLLAPLAIASGPIAALLLRRHVPAGAEYYNVGHANLSRWRLRAFRKFARCRITVLIHDVIPLQHPEFTRPGTQASFRRKMKAVAREADRIICTCNTTGADVRAALKDLGRVPPIVVAPLGIDQVDAAPDRQVVDLLAGRPYFLAIGTIEPRKGYDFLLDLWEEMHRTRPLAEIPCLVIAGRRGWRNDAVFSRLDRLPMIGQTVFECANLSDGAIASLMEGAEALLFPSRAEGFGLPPIEAAARGCPVLCLPLPVFEEMLGDYPVYLKEGDGYSWLETMDGLMKTGRQRDRMERRRHTIRRPPEWGSHFNRALSQPL